MSKVGNNGHQLAHMMHDSGLLWSGMTYDDVIRIAKEEGLMMNNDHLDTETFYEDFCYAAEGDLKYKLYY